MQRRQRYHNSFGRGFVSKPAASTPRDSSKPQTPLPASTHSQQKQKQPPLVASAAAPTTKHNIQTSTASTNPHIPITKPTKPKAPPQSSSSTEVRKVSKSPKPESKKHIVAPPSKKRKLNSPASPSHPSKSPPQMQQSIQPNGLSNAPQPLQSSDDISAMFASIKRSQADQLTQLESACKARLASECALRAERKAASDKRYTAWAEKVKVSLRMAESVEEDEKAFAAEWPPEKRERVKKEYARSEQVSKKYKKVVGKMKVQQRQLDNMRKRLEQEKKEADERLEHEKREAEERLKRKQEYFDRKMKKDSDTINMLRDRIARGDVDVDVDMDMDDDLDPEDTALEDDDDDDEAQKAVAMDEGRASQSDASIDE